MAVETLSGVPSYFRAGSTVRFTLRDSSHPATAWTLAFTLRGKGQLTIAGEASGSDFIVTLTAAQTAALLPGRYGFQTLFTETASNEVEAGQAALIDVLPNLADTSTGPARAAYESALLALRGLAAQKFASVSVEGESYSLQSLQSLQALVDRLHIEAIAEDKERGISTQGGLVRIQMRM